MRSASLAVNERHVLLHAIDPPHVRQSGGEEPQSFYSGRLFVELSRLDMRVYRFRRVDKLVDSSGVSAGIPFNSSTSVACALAKPCPAWWPYSHNSIECLS